MKISLKAFAPLVVAVVLALLPAPAGCPPHAWYYFAIFSGVIVGLMFEPVPGAAVGFIGVTLAAVLAPWVLFSPQELARPGFSAANSALNWALSGFANGSVWLIFAAFMFTLGYEKTGLGPRIALALVRLMGRRTLLLGYAIVFSDAILAPFTPSNTARSAGTIYPIIRNVPMLYDSKPNDPSYRRIGAYIMWTAMAGTAATSSMFVTALSSNLLAMEFARRLAKIDISWVQWFVAMLPVSFLFLLFVPLVVYWLYPPEVKQGQEVPEWAAVQLEKLGPLSARELLFAAMVCAALILWISASNFINPTTVALIVISLMLLARLVTWKDMLENTAAWNTLVWFSTLVALADGLNRVGFVKWFAEMIGGHMGGFPPTTAMIVLVLVFFFSHYMFASATAHVTALIPVMLTVGAAIPGLNMIHFTLLMGLTLGIMGVLTPYATGPAPVYQGSGYLPAREFWLLGGIFGLIYIGTLLIIVVPWLAFLG
jgi:L-tartrate/succinate antiporter